MWILNQTGNKLITVIDIKMSTTGDLWNVTGKDIKGVKHILGTFDDDYKCQQVFNKIIYALMSNQNIVVIPKNEEV